MNEDNIFLEYDFDESELEEVDEKKMYSNFLGEEEDEYGHAWGMGWEESDKPHPGFGTYGGYVSQCYKCGIYAYEFCGGTGNPGKYEFQRCDKKIRSL